MTEPAVEALGLARSELTRRLNVIGSSDWEKATPCTEWNVRQLVNHVVGLQHRVARLVCGGSRDEYVATREDDWIGVDHTTAWHVGVRALDAAITNARSLDIPVAYRLPMSARGVIGLTAFDTAVHTWDVSRAIGFDEQLDDGLVEFALGFMDWIRSEPQLMVLFDSPKGHLEKASAQARLLQLAGRDPSRPPALPPDVAAATHLPCKGSHGTDRQRRLQELPGWSWDAPCRRVEGCLSRLQDYGSCIMTPCGLPVERNSSDAMTTRL
ncbi:MAG: hypothetical protein QOF67_1420 [Mycobacterium sp.]|nr:hypothetical protein [Mycobacterium sp.]